MAYTVLARKYRSQTFDDVIGQDPIAQTLKNAIKTGRVAHAYLFSGTRGVGKTTMARILAKALYCLSSDEPTIEPCCKCDSCIAVNAGEDIDVIEIDGATNNGVEQVRELRQNAIYRPARARFKIYIIDEVHMLSVAAFNALLKTLEEPPSHVKFIFATTEPNKVIATIQSRCQRFDFSNISPAVIGKQLKSILDQEKIKYDDDLVLPLAKMANGSMRDGLSLLDRLISIGVEPLSASLLEQYLGCPDSDKIWNLIAQIGDNSAAGTLAAVDDLISTGISEVQIVDSLIDFMRDLMVIKSAGADSNLVILTDQQRNRAAELVEKFDVAALIYNIASLEKMRWAVKNSDTSRALLEASLLRFALSEHFMNVDALLSQTKSGSHATISPDSGKKKITLKAHGETPAPLWQAADEEIETPPQQSGSFSGSNTLQSIKDNWPEILRLITSQLAPGTGGLLSSAEPVRFENGVLTLEFGPSGHVHKRICESNGRTEQIETLLSTEFSTRIKLKFEIAAGERKQPEPNSREQKIGSKKRYELANDPAVKTVLLGLDATIMGIEPEPGQ